MKYKERIDTFLELQKKGMNFEDISTQLEVKPATLKSFLNKRGYKFDAGKYILKEVEQLNFVEIPSIKTEENKTAKRKNAKTQPKVEKIKPITKVSNVKNSTSTSKKVKPKNDRKINLTQEDLDKLCEVYDWYLEVKDYKTMKPKTKVSSKSKKDINIEDKNVGELKSTTIRIDKGIWEDFERLCSNSEFSKSQILTQALKDFMREYKHLI